MINLNIPFSVSYRETDVRPLKDVKVLSILNEEELQELSELMYKAEASYFIYLDELERLLRFFEKKLKNQYDSGDRELTNELSEFVSRLEKIINGIPTPQLMVLKASGIST
jgi:hypothetical protein